MFKLLAFFCFFGSLHGMVPQRAPSPINTRPKSNDLMDVLKKNMPERALSLIPNMTGTTINAMFNRRTRETALHFASQMGYTEVVKALLKKRAYLDNKDFHGNTPLHLAIKHGNIEIAKILVTDGASINIQNSAGKTALDLAKENNNSDLLNHIYRYQANIFSQKPRIKSSIKTFPREMKPLYNDITLADLQSADLQSADLQSADIKSHEPEIWLPTIPDIIQISRLPQNKKLLRASAAGQNDQVEEALNNGANVNTTDDKGSTPLHLACENNHAEIVKILLTSRALPNVFNKSGKLPIHIATQNGNNIIVELLLKKNININIKDSQKLTPLHHAAEKGFTKIATMLLQKGADVNAQAIDNLTPLHVAVLNNHSTMVYLLLEAGADTSLLDSQGKTALDIAQENGLSDIAQHLKSVSTIRLPRPKTTVTLPAPTKKRELKTTTTSHKKTQIKDQSDIETAVETDIE